MHCTNPISPTTDYQKQSPTDVRNPSLLMAPEGRTRKIAKGEARQVFDAVMHWERVKLFSAIVVRDKVRAVPFAGTKG